MKRGKTLEPNRIRRAYQVRLMPTIEQANALASYAAVARMVYNWALAEWRRQYAAHRLAKKAPERALRLLTRWGSPLADDERWTNPAESTPPNAFALHAMLTAAKRGELIPRPHKVGRVPGPWLASTPSLIIREAVADVGAAYEHFFRRLKEGVTGREAGEPRFRSARFDLRFHIDQGTALELSREAIRIPVLGWVRVRPHHYGYIPLGQKICGLGISRTNGSWYAAVRLEVDAPASVPQRARTVPGKTLGVEVGVRALAVMSNGKTVLDRRGVRPLTDKARKCVESHEKRIASADRRLALWSRRMARRWREGKSRHEQSAGWLEAVRHVQRLHEYIANVRKELIHYTSRRVVDSGAEVVKMREPAVKGMIRKAGKKDEAARARNRLAPAVSKIGWYALQQRIQYKQAWRRASYNKPAEGSFVLVPQDHPTTRTCSVCGLARETEASYPDFICTSCGHREDRDDNAAKVLRDFAPSSDGSKGAAGTTRRKTGRKAGTTATRSGTPGGEQSAATGPHGAETSPLGSGNGAPFAG